MESKATQTDCETQTETQLETQQETYGDDCEYDDDYQEQDYAIGRKDKITWTTSLTIPDEFEKRDEFIFAIQDFLNFGYNANECYHINLPRSSHFWRDIYMFYYKNIVYILMIIY